MMSLMHPTLKSLVELQEEDVRLLELRAQLAKFPKRLAEMDAQLAAARGEVEKTKTAQLAAVKGRKKFELDAEQCKERIRKFKDQSSQVKTNEAYKALLHEIEMAEQDLARSEDKLLEEMVAAEEFDRQIKIAERTQKETETVVRAEREVAEREWAALQMQTDERETHRKALVAACSEDKLDHYIRIAKRHGGIALAQVREQGNDQACAMCGVRILPHVFEDIRKMETEELIHCETCTRILYYIAPAAAPKTTATADGTSVVVAEASSNQP
jgi:uncharacterized protein